MSDTPRTDANKHAIAHLERYGFENSLHDRAVEWPILCEEIERELAEANHQIEKYAAEARQAIDAHGAAVIELAAVKQTMGELCESCGWAMRFPGQPCRCELERELAGLKESIASLSHPNCRDLLRERNEAREQLDDAIVEATNAVNDIIGVRYQRDRLAEALLNLCYGIIHDKSHDMPEYLSKAKQALAAVEGGTP